MSDDRGAYGTEARWWDPPGKAPGTGVDCPPAEYLDRVQCKRGLPWRPSSPRRLGW